MRMMLKNKLHRARVTDANIDYEGSITIDKHIMAATDILPYERVEVLNINNGARFGTYAIEGEKGEICLNGAAARLAAKGDLVIILTYSYIEDAKADNFIPGIVHVDSKNEIIETRRAFEPITLMEAEQCVLP